MSKGPNKAPGRGDSGGSGKRAMGYMLIAGAGLTQPRTRYDEGSALKNRESPDFSRGECQSIANYIVKTIVKD